MASSDWKLTVLSLPQSWSGRTRRLDVNALVLPRGNPLEPLMNGGGPERGEPAFADAVLSFEIKLIGGLDRLPALDAVAFSDRASNTTPPGLRPLYQELSLLFPIAPSDSPLPPPEPRRARTQIRKYLPQSYRTALDLSHPRTAFGVFDDTYRCVLTTPPATAPPPSMRWGQVIAAVLSQHRLAERLGLIYAMSLTIPDSVDLGRGGWVYVSLAEDSTYGNLVPPQGENIKLFAARIPPVRDRARTIFAPLVFPVPSPAVSFDDELAEAESLSSSSRSVEIDRLLTLRDTLTPKPEGVLKSTDIGAWVNPN